MKFRANGIKKVKVNDLSKLSENRQFQAVSDENVLFFYEDNKLSSTVNLGVLCDAGNPPKFCIMSDSINYLKKIGYYDEDIIKSNSKTIGGIFINGFASVSYLYAKSYLDLYITHIEPHNTGYY